MARIADLIANTGGVSEPARFYGLTSEEFMAFVGQIAESREPENVAGFLASTGERFGKRVFGVKWTGAHRYAPVFLEANADAYWLEIIRNPYARKSSVAFSHGANAFASAKMSHDQFDFVSQFRHKRYRVLRYEDICASADETAETLSSWLDEEIANCGLRDPLGKPFRPNTSENIVRGKSDRFSFQDPSLGAHIGALDPNRWQSRITEFDIALINRVVDFHGYYEHKTPGSRARVGAAYFDAWHRLRALLGRTLRSLPTRIGRQ